MIYKGDKVQCISNIYAYVHKGRTYTVRDVRDEKISLTDTCNEGEDKYDFYYYMDDFKLCVSLESLIDLHNRGLQALELIHKNPIWKAQTEYNGFGDDRWEPLALYGQFFNTRLRIKYQ